MELHTLIESVFEGADPAIVDRITHLAEKEYVDDPTSFETLKASMLDEEGKPKTLLKSQNNDYLEHRLEYSEAPEGYVESGRGDIPELEADEEPASFAEAPEGYKYSSVHEYPYDDDLEWVGEKRIKREAAAYRARVGSKLFNFTIGSDFEASGGRPPEPVSPLHVELQHSAIATESKFRQFMHSIGVLEPIPVATALKMVKAKTEEVKKDLNGEEQEEIDPNDLVVFPFVNNSRNSVETTDLKTEKPVEEDKPDDLEVFPFVSPSKDPAVTKHTVKSGSGILAKATGPNITVNVKKGGSK